MCCPWQLDSPWVVLKHWHRLPLPWVQGGPCIFEVCTVVPGKLGLIQTGPETRSVWVWWVPCLCVSSTQLIHLYGNTGAAWTQMLVPVSQLCGWVAPNALSVVHLHSQLCPCSHCVPPHDVTSRSLTIKEDQQHSLISLLSAQWHLPYLSQIHRWARRAWENVVVSSLMGVCGSHLAAAQPPDPFHLIVRLSDFTHSRDFSCQVGVKKQKQSHHRKWLKKYGSWHR